MQMNAYIKNKIKNKQTKKTGHRHKQGDTS